MKDEFNLIDPPVTPYSTKGEIRDWIKQLNDMPDSKEKALCLSQAEKWLKDHPGE